MKSYSIIVKGLVVYKCKVFQLLTNYLADVNFWNVTLQIQIHNGIVAIKRDLMYVYFRISVFVVDNIYLKISSTQ